MRVCEVTTKANLPELWMVMANASKKEFIVAIQALADNRAAEASLSREAPIIMPEIYKCLNSAHVGGLDLDNITVGLSPFLMHVGYGAEAKSARERATAFTLVHSGGGAPDLSQVRELTSSAPTMVVTCIALMSTYKAYAMLLDLVLASTHRVAANFHVNFLPQIERRMRILEEAFGSRLHQVLPCFLHHTQLTMGQYWNEVGTFSPASPLSNAMDLIGLIDMRQWPLLPPLPNRYLRPLLKPPVPQTPDTEPNPCRRAQQEGDDGGGSGSITNDTPDSNLAEHWHRANKRL